MENAGTTETEATHRASHTTLATLQPALTGGDGLEQLAQTTLRELGLTSPSTHDQLVALSLAFCQQRELILMVELNRRLAEEAEGTGQSFAALLFDTANKAIYEPVLAEIDRLHRKAEGYRKQLVRDHG